MGAKETQKHEPQHWQQIRHILISVHTRTLDIKYELKTTMAAARSVLIHSHTHVHTVSVKALVTDQRCENVRRCFIF